MEKTGHKTISLKRVAFDLNRRTFGKWRFEIHFSIELQSQGSLKISTTFFRDKASEHSSHLLDSGSDLFILGFVIYEIEHIDIFSGLADAFDTTEALFEP